MSKSAEPALPAGAPQPSIAAHPRAAQQVRKAKGAGALICFVAAVGLSLGARVPLPETLLRALAAGVFGYLAAWAVGVGVWRELIRAEVALEAKRRGLGGDAAQ